MRHACHVQRVCIVGTELRLPVAKKVLVEIESGERVVAQEVYEAEEVGFWAFGVLFRVNGSRFHCDRGFGGAGAGKSGEEGQRREV